MQTPSIAGGGLIGQIDIAKQLPNVFKAVFEATAETLCKVTDVASARAALPQLTDELAQLVKVREMTEQVSSDAKRTVVTTVGHAKPAMLEIIRGLGSIPDVAAVLKPTLDKIQSSLDTFMTAV